METTADQRYQQSIARVQHWFQGLRADSVEVPRHERTTRETPTYHFTDEVNTVGVLPQDNAYFTAVDNQVNSADTSRYNDALNAHIENFAHGTPANAAQHNEGMPTANTNNDTNAYGANIAFSGMIAPPNPYPYASLGAPPEPQPVPGWFTNTPLNTFQAFARMRRALPIRRSL